MPAIYYLGVAVHLAAAVLWVGAFSVLVVSGALAAKAWRAVDAS